MLFQSRGRLHAWARVPLRFYSRSIPLKRMRHPRQPDAGSLKFRPTASPSSEERLDLNPTWSEFNRGRYVLLAKFQFPLLISFPRVFLLDLSLTSAALRALPLQKEQALRRPGSHPRAGWPRWQWLQQLRNV